MKSKEFMDKDVFALDEKIGQVKEIGIDPEEWKITHLEIELKKDVAESVLGAKKGGVRNMLAVSSLEKGVARWTEKGLHLKVSKDQLHMYLRPVVETSPVKVETPTVAGPTETVLELQNPQLVIKGETVSFKGKLFRSDSGKGIPGVNIDIFERDKSILGDDYLAFGNTTEDGLFSIDWKARSLTWFDNTGKTYALFKGNEQAKPSKSAIHSITIN